MYSVAMFSTWPNDFCLPNIWFFVDVRFWRVDERNRIYILNLRKNYQLISASFPNEILILIFHLFKVKNKENKQKSLISTIDCVSFFRSVKLDCHAIAKQKEAIHTKITVEIGWYKSPLNNLNKKDLCSWLLSCLF